MYRDGSYTVNTMYIFEDVDADNMGFNIELCCLIHLDTCSTKETFLREFLSTSEAFTLKTHESLFFEAFTEINESRLLRCHEVQGIHFIILSGSYFFC